MTVSIRDHDSTTDDFSDHYSRENVEAVDDGLELKIKQWGEDFEDGNRFTDGELSVSRETSSAKDGDYGLLTDGGEYYEQKVDSSFGKISPSEYIDGDSNVIRFRTWVKPESGYGLGGIAFGIPDYDTKNGYQVVIDTRDEDGGSAGLHIRTDFNGDDDHRIAEDEVTINTGDWYFLMVSWHDSGKISAVLEDDTGSEIASCSGTDTTYTEGYFGIASWDETSFDGYYLENVEEYSTEGYRTSRPRKLSPIDELEDSLIEWEETLNGGTITIESSTNLGDSWDTCTNGEPIPNLPTDISDETLLIRQTLETEDTTVTPRLEELNVELNTAVENSFTHSLTSDYTGISILIPITNSYSLTCEISEKIRFQQEATLQLYHDALVLEESIFRLTGVYELTSEFGHLLRGWSDILKDLNNNWRDEDGTTADWTNE